MREFAVLVQKGEKFNEEALSLAKKNILLPNNGGVLSQNLEIYPVNETIKKIFAFTLLALRYFELHKNNEINEDKEEFYQEAETPKHFYNEFLEEEVPSVLKVQPSKPQLIENSEFEAFDKEKERFNEKKNDKTNERINKKLNNSIDDYKKYDNNKGKPQNNKERTLKMDAGLNETKQIFKDQLRSRTDRPSKKEEIINKMLNKQKIMNNQRSLFYDEVLDKRKKSLLQKKETKFEKIMKIKVRKPKAISQIRLQLNASNILISSPLKNEYKTKRNKSLNLSQNSMFSKQDNSETIGERLVKEDMVTLQKEMKKLASQKAKLNNAFNRELKKVEEFKKLKEIERERRRERELEQRFLKKKSFETKQEKKSIKEDKYSEYYKNRQVKKQNFENK
ncbi:MAG: hypothetical protein KDE33_24970, partial [Bacteroidetes bacterium]|nr:hypothetical protein [Bacteroidota bacterium]